MYLDKISSPADLKGLRDDEVGALASEIRAEIIKTVSKNGGHLASNLGVVELTLALHRVFDSPHDRILFDVGHQCYTHKLITGRLGRFDTLRRTGGLSGFMRPDESEHDFFGSAHSSNSISAAIGMAAAAKLSGDDSTTVAVIGDGAFTGGMAYEALNNCVDKDLRLVIVLNDNEMSISRNVGAIDNYFARFRTSGRYIKFKNRFTSFLSKLPGKLLYSFFRGVKNSFKRIVLKENFFELLGLEYYGPIDGNNEKQLETVLSQIKRQGRGITVVHVRTKKGLGYPPAEREPDCYHSVSPFDVKKGVVHNSTVTFSGEFGSAAVALARKYDDLCAVTAAMTSGTGLSGFAREFPDRMFDVGIAEEHAATFCAGLCSGGRRAVFAVYSTFMQRCYDQLIMDAALQGLSVVLAVDRAGFVGDDGPTHHGLFDVPLLATVPGALVYSPDSPGEISDCLEKCLEHKGVSAVRYPRGGEWSYDRTTYIRKNDLFYADFGSPEACIITYGRLSSICDRAARLCGNVRVIRLLRIIPPDIDLIRTLTADTSRIVICEEGAKNGGVAQTLCASLSSDKKDIIVKAVEGFVPHGAIDDILKSVGLDADSIADAVRGNG